MDILAGLKDKLQFIQHFYESAAYSFREIKRKIDVEEAPFEPPPFNPDTDDTEPPFLTEWIDADESIDILGQASLTLVQSALMEYLRGFVGISGLELHSGKGNRFRRYQQLFLEAYGIDWNKGPVKPTELEEINLARNDIQHGGEEFGMARRQSKEHHSRFPEGLFIRELDKEAYREGPHIVGARIYVSEETLHEAIRRVFVFCEFLDSKRRW